MTEREAIERIQNDLKLHHDDLSGQYRKALRFAISALEKQERDKWVPCKERLPEEGVEILVTDEDGDIRHVTYEDLVLSKKFITCEEGQDVYGVNAWRPLPEPYTEEES